MTGRKKTESCCPTPGKSGNRCRVESLITVDERGQMVLPKDLRERIGLSPGEKLALISWEKDGQVCCFTLIRADALADHVKGFLEPMMMGGDK